jgi:hypothetical protein
VVVQEDAKSQGGSPGVRGEHWRRPPEPSPRGPRRTSWRPGVLPPDRRRRHGENVELLGAGWQFVCLVASEFLPRVLWVQVSMTFMGTLAVAIPTMRVSLAQPLLV